MKKIVNDKKNIIVFAIVFLMIFIYIYNYSPIGKVQDAYDIWQTIRSYYSPNIYPSYVLYKGFSSVYPYVWFYQISQVLNFDEFLLVKIYYSFLFTWISCVGMPNLVFYFTKYKPKSWQIIIFSLLLFYYWNSYKVLNRLIVDLPSAAYFIMSVNAAININKSNHKIFCVIITGVLCGIVANTSGQYFISALCVILFSCFSIAKIQDYSKKNKIWAIVILCFSFGMIKIINELFMFIVVEPLRASGGWIPTGKSWMERAIFYMMAFCRYLPTMKDQRGLLIIKEIYGAEKGMEMWDLSGQGGYGWSVIEYIGYFFKMFFNFIILIINRIVIALSDSGKNNNLSKLLPYYTCTYISCFQFVSSNKSLKSFFNYKNLLLLAFVTSIIPALVMTVEMRYVISLQALIFAFAVLSNFFPLFYIKIKNFFISVFINKQKLSNYNFPWPFIGLCIFCLLMLACYGALCMQGDITTDGLFHW